MTQTLQRTARDAITNWLDTFQKALDTGDVVAASDLFGAESYWRDLAAFTWNIVTVEGPEGVRDLLDANLERLRPTGFAVADDLGEPAEAGGVTESWIQFETAIGRGVGHLRIKDGKAWTLLTSMFELKGYEEPTSDRRPKGRNMARTPTGRPGWNGGRRRPRSWDTPRSPTR